jgi:hypothetical protein
MSIIGMISQYVTPTVIQQIARMLGMQPGVAEKALGAAIPAILAGLLGTAKSGAGADAFKAALGNQKAGGLEGLGALLSGAGGADVATGGQEMLTSILGGNRAGALKTALSGYAGTPDASAGSLLGIAGTAIMGALGKTATDGNLDSKQVFGLLNDERDEIARVLPSDFASKLGNAGLLDALSDKMDLVGADVGAGAAAAASTAKRTAAETSSRIDERATRASSAARTAAAQPMASRSGRPWWQWLIGLLVLLALLYWLVGMFNRPEPEPAPPPATSEAPAPAPTTPAPATPTPATPSDTASLTVDGVDLGEAAQGALAGLTETLGSVTDAASATAAVPRLTEIGTTLTDVQSKIGQLPEAGAAELRTMIGGALPAIRTTVDNLLGNSAVADILRPVVEPIITTLSAMAG